MMKNLFFIFIINSFFLTPTISNMPFFCNKKTASQIILGIGLKPEKIQNDTVLDLKLYKKKAKASYYANKFNGRKTTSGSIFDNQKLTAAHRNLPFGTKLKITNLTNSKSVIVTVTDRGCFSKKHEIDITKKAFMQISDSKKKGFLFVSIEIIKF